MKNIYIEPVRELIMIKRLFLALLLFTLITLYSCADIGGTAPGADGSDPAPDNDSTVPTPDPDESNPDENGTYGDGEHQHVFCEWFVVHEADCVRAGAKMRSCDCGKTELSEIEPLGHQIEEVKGVDPTCTESGYADYEMCKRCPYTTFKDISALGHTKGETVKTQDPTCTEYGKMATLCLTCREVMSIDRINPTGHKASPMVFMDGEKHASVCELCTTTLATEAHTRERVTITPPTYAQGGEDHLICRGCNGILAVIPIDALPKEKPEYTLPEGITVEYGTYAHNLLLPTGFSLAGGYPNCFNTVGGVSVELTYTAPYDTEGRYETVTDIWITVTVVKRVVALDAVAPEGKVYDGKPIMDPAFSCDYADYVRIDWYRGNQRLNGAPTSAGEYTVTVSVDHKCYTAEPKEFSVIIEKSPDPFGDFFIPDAAYTGHAVVIDLSRFEGEVTLTLTDADKHPIDSAVNYGLYYATITVSESENYLSATRVCFFSITPDITPPTIVGEDYVYPDPGSFTIPFTDNVGIDYFVINDFTASTYETRSSTVALKAGAIYEIYAIDISGNKSERLMVITGSSYIGQNGYRPEIYPQNGAVVRDSYVFISATDSSRIFFGEDPDNLRVLEAGAIGGLRNGVTYYWYAECSVYDSPLYSFTVSYSANTIPVPEYPKNNSVVNEKYPVFSVLCSTDYEIYYKPYGLEDNQYRRVYNSYTTLEYGRTYVWYAISSTGARSEEQTFTYLPENLSENPDGMWFVGGEDVTYINDNFFVVRASSIVRISRVNYYIVKADGSNIAFNYSSAPVARYYHNLDGTGEFYDLIAGLEDGDTVYYRLVGGTDDMAHSEVRKVIVDLSAPTAGAAEITEKDTGFEVKISVGQDAVGAEYSYRVLGGEWCSYSEEITLTLELSYLVLELRATDAVGNVTTARFTAGTPEILPPAIEVIDYTEGTVSNKTVKISLTPSLVGTSYYYLNGEGHKFTDIKTVSLSRDGEYEIYTAVENDGVIVYSAPHTVRVDKTAPEVNGIIMRADMDGYVRAWRWYPGIVVGYDDLIHRVSTSGAGDMNAIVIDPSLTVDASDVSYSYMVLDINTSFKPLEKYNDFYLYNYSFGKSGKYTIRIRATDAAGNYSDYDIDWLVDVEGPTAESEQFDRGEDGKGYAIRLDGISDDTSRCTKIVAYVLNAHAFITAEGAIIEEFTNENGFTEFVYDLSYLPNGDFYAVIFMLYDELENRTISSQLSFYKRDEDRVEVTEDGLYFERYEDGYRLVSIKTDKTTLVLPESYKGERYTVVTGALLYNSTVTEVVLPAGLIVDRAAFSSSTGIERVYFCGSDAEWDLGGYAAAFGEYVTVAFLASDSPDAMLWDYAEDGTPTLIPRYEDTGDTEEDEA